MCISDHFLPSSRFGRSHPPFVQVTDARSESTATCLAIPGAELHGRGTLRHGYWHLVAVGLPPHFEVPGADETGHEIALRAQRAGAFVGIAHPHHTNATEGDILSIIDAVDAIEVYNHTAQVDTQRGMAFHAAEAVASLGHQIGFFAADDTHFVNLRGPFSESFGGWVHVFADDRSEEAIVRALKEHRYYSSTGPRIEGIEVDETLLRVTGSPIDSVIVSGRGSEFAIVRGRSEVSMAIEVPFLRTAPYVRVTVVDQFGKTAWTNPLWLSD